jgi:hypothetical protein
MYHFNGKDYAYRTFLETHAKSIPAQPKEKQKLAIASLNSLVNIFNQEIKDKIIENPDLLVFASNLILANYANKNDDCVLFEDLIQIAEKFEYKQVNSEHNRDLVRGVIDEVGWSVYPSNEIIEEEEIQNQSNPVQLVIGGYLWRVVDPDLCNLIEEASNEKSDNYLAVSTSFELLFNDYWICISPDKNALNPNARFITKENPEWSNFDSKLKTNGGSGQDGGMLIFRVLKDEILPVGAGIVKNPASGIKGIAVVNENSVIDVEDTEEMDNMDCPCDSQANQLKQELKGYLSKQAETQMGVHICDLEMEDGSILNNVPIYNCSYCKDVPAKMIRAILKVKNFIKETNSSVTENKLKLKIPMVIKSLQELESHYSDFTKLEAKTAVASIQGFMEEKVKELSEKHAAELKEKEEAAAATEKLKAELESRAANLGKAVEELQTKLAEIEQKQASAAAEQKFNERMASLDETFDLEDEDRALLVDEVKEIQSDESFASWMEKKKKLMKEKTKTYKAEKAKYMKDKMAKAGITVELDEKTLDLKEVIASVTANSSNIQVPNTPIITEDLREKTLKAFSEGISVAGIKK